MSVLLVSAGYDHTIRFWEALTGVCLRTIQHPDSQVNRLEITNDKKLLAAAGHQNIRLYDIKTSNSNPVASFEGHRGRTLLSKYGIYDRRLCPATTSTTRP